MSDDILANLKQRLEHAIKEKSEITQPDGSLGQIKQVTKEGFNYYEVSTGIFNAADIVSVIDVIKAVLIDYLVHETHQADQIKYGIMKNIETALQINVGLRHNGLDLLEDKYTQLDIASRMVPRLKETLPLVVQYETSYLRFNNPFFLSNSHPHYHAFGGHPTMGTVGVRTEGGFNYFENRLPGSDCQPYKAVLTTLYALYVAYTGHLKQNNCHGRGAMLKYMPDEEDELWSKRIISNKDGDLQNCKGLFKFLNKIPVRKNLVRH